MGSSNSSLGRGLTAAGAACLLMAMMASVSSVSISAFAGWQRGESIEQKLLLAAVSVIAVVGVHLLPAICRQATPVARAFGLLLWSICAVFVAYGHASYYLITQENAGEHRVAALAPTQLTTVQSPKRALPAILADVSRLTASQAAVSLAGCSEDCSGRRARIDLLKARMRMLEAEADEAKRWQLAQDRMESRRIAARDDPVITRLAGSLGVAIASVGLVMGFLFSVSLEGLGCFCWYLWSQRHDRPVTYPVIETVTERLQRDPVETAATARDMQPRSELEVLAEKVKSEIEAGRVCCTVTAIRAHLQCGQAKAASIRRLIADCDGGMDLRSPRRSAQAC